MKEEKEALRELLCITLAGQKLYYNDPRHFVSVQGRIVALTPTEYRLWRHLLERAIQIQREDNERLLERLLMRVEALQAVTGLERYLVLRYLRKVNEKFHVTPFAIAGDVRLGFVFLKKPEE